MRRSERPHPAGCAVFSLTHNPQCVQVIGAGPAGCAAALAALTRGAGVRIYEKSRFPRHKVCGEFLSPEAAGILERLGAARPLQAAQPAAIRRVEIHFGRRCKTWELFEPALGISRFCLDSLLLDEAAARGAAVIRESATPSESPCVLAHGRHGAGVRGSRLFGFKAHFTGPADDRVRLFFFDRCYAGVSSVEGLRTNICALAPEALLRSRGFDIDAVLEACPALRDHLRSLRREMDWLITGPLVFQDAFEAAAYEGIYPAGDALAFVDPFTGSGILSALFTGELAGIAAASRRPVREYLADCRRMLGPQYRVARWLRAAVSAGWAEAAAPLVPGRWLFEATRPRLRG